MEGGKLGKKIAPNRISSTIGASKWQILIVVPITDITPSKSKYLISYLYYTNNALKNQLIKAYLTYKYLDKRDKKSPKKSQNPLKSCYFSCLTVIIVRKII